MEKKIAIFGDIHSNLEALIAVINDACNRDVTDYVCVGDVVGYNASPSECIQVVKELGCVTVRGNHDHTARMMKIWMIFSRWLPASLHGLAANFPTKM